MSFDFTGRDLAGQYYPHTQCIRRQADGRFFQVYPLCAVLPLLRHRKYGTDGGHVAGMRNTLKLDQSISTSIKTIPSAVSPLPSCSSASAPRYSFTCPLPSSATASRVREAMKGRVLRANIR